ncbi:DNA repair protein RecN [Lentisphaerota bacterium ZTH]|nr:DNA repair protein RecN [Lentisphaerota bacterium]WET06111.1 DNA repair protein RecN [Lentisphaerota bacterium ZTH]
MLNWLKIKNLALIEKADVEFADGFNVITGETGAGKSILLNTISLLLGSRADKGVIRNGASRCELAAGIALSPGTIDIIEPVLQHADIPLERDFPEIQLRRVITRSQNRNFINDTPVTLQTLKNIGDYLIDVHAANEHQSLLSRTRQLELLDRYAGLNNELKACSETCRLLTELRRKRDEVFSDMPSSVEAEHLQMIVDEIEKVAPQPGEEEALTAKHAVAANSKTVLQLASSSVMQLSQSENSLIDQLGGVYRDLQELNGIDPANTAAMLEACDHLVENMRELAFDIENYTSSVELDEEAFIELESRLSELQTLKRRYGPSMENVLDELERASQRLLIHHDAAELREKFASEEQQLLKKLEKQAKELSIKRHEAAKNFSQLAMEKLRLLGFLQSKLEIDFTEIEPGERGMDRVEIMFCANPGEQMQPLRNIASSGEISRVMLALKTVLANADAIPVLIFDEIDVNIGGETAKQVGRELRGLAAGRQVLCISHLAQVAACGQQHYTVSKKVDSGRTISSIKLLNNQKRITEISRMLGGGKAAENHAVELIETQSS